MIPFWIISVTSFVSRAFIFSLHEFSSTVGSMAIWTRWKAPRDFPENSQEPFLFASVLNVVTLQSLKFFREEQWSTGVLSIGSEVDLQYPIFNSPFLIYSSNLFRSKVERIQPFNSFLQTEDLLIQRRRILARARDFNTYSNLKRRMAVMWTVKRMTSFYSMTWSLNRHHSSSPAFTSSYSCIVLLYSKLEAVGPCLRFRFLLVWRMDGQILSDNDQYSS